MQAAIQVPEHRNNNKKDSALVAKAMRSITAITSKVTVLGGFGSFIRSIWEQGPDYAFATWCWQNEELDELVMQPPDHHGTTPELARQVYHRLLVRRATENVVVRQRWMVVLMCVGALAVTFLLNRLFQNHQSTPEYGYGYPAPSNPFDSIFSKGFWFLAAAFILGLLYAAVALILTPVIMRGVLTDKMRVEVEGVVRRCFLYDVPDNAPADLADVWRHGWLTSEAAPISSEITDTDASSTAAVEAAQVFRWITTGAFFFLPLCATLFIPVIIWWWFTLRMSRTDLAQRKSEIELQRAVEGSLFIAAGGRAWALAQEKARVEQIQNAIRDEKPPAVPGTTQIGDMKRLVDLGTTTGIMAARGDLFAPSENLPFQMSLHDLQNHLIVFGGVGAGKTSGVLRPLAKQIAEWDKVGIVVMDGKGALPKELEALQGMTVIDPATTIICLVSGLTPNEVIDTIADLLAGKGNMDRFWTDSAAALLRQAAIMAHAAGEAFWTLDSIKKAATETTYRAQLLRNISNEMILGSAPLTEAINYFEREWNKPNSAEDRTRASIQTIAQTWIATITAHPDLLRWSQATKSRETADISGPLRGGRLGFLIPAYRYGRAGAVVTALLKARLYAGLKARADQGMGKDGTPIVFLIDEVQEVSTEEDATMLAIGRSLGLAVIGATQTVEGVREKLGEATAAKLLAIYGGLVMLPGRSPLTDEFAADRVGLTWAATVQERPGATLRETMQRDVLTGLTAAGRYQGFMQAGANGPRQLRGVFSALISQMQGAVSEPTSKIGPAPVVISGELLTLLAKPDTALIIATRGRVQRRDVVQLAPLYETDIARKQ